MEPTSLKADVVAADKHTAMHRSGSVVVDSANNTSLCIDTPRCRVG